MSTKYFLEVRFRGPTEKFGEWTRSINFPRSTEDLAEAQRWCDEANKDLKRNSGVWNLNPYGPQYRVAREAEPIQYRLQVRYPDGYTEGRFGQWEDSASFPHSTDDVELVKQWFEAAMTEVLEFRRRAKQRSSREYRIFPAPPPAPVKQSPPASPFKVSPELLETFKMPPDFTDSTKRIQHLCDQAIRLRNFVEQWPGVFPQRTSGDSLDNLLHWLNNYVEQLIRPSSDLKRQMATIFGSRALSVNLQTQFHCQCGRCCAGDHLGHFCINPECSQFLVECPNE